MGAHIPPTGGPKPGPPASTIRLLTVLSESPVPPSVNVIVMMLSPLSLPIGNGCHWLWSALHFHHCVPTGVFEGNVTVTVTVAPGVKHVMLKLNSPCGKFTGPAVMGTAVKSTIQPMSGVNEAIPVPVAVATDFVAA